MRAKTILIVDAQPIVREGYKSVFENERDLTVAGEVSTFSEARAALSECLPDAVIVDLNLPDAEGMDLVKGIRAKFDQLPVLVAAQQSESIYAERLLSAGANGYIMKRAPVSELLKALRRVLDGGIYVSEQIGANMIERMALNGSKTISDPVARLSNREIQVLGLISRGENIRGIASTLKLSVRTVECHRLRIRKKLNIEDTSKLVRFAVNWGLNQH